jgi:opacity protein-like surface antigen
MKRMRSAAPALLVIAAAGSAWGQEIEAPPQPIGPRPPILQGNEWISSLRVAYGLKALDEALWAPSDIQDEISLMADFGRKDWPIRLAVDFHYGSETATVADGSEPLDFESTSAELNLGARLYYPLGEVVSLTMSGGLCLGWAEAALEGVEGRDSESDTGVGYWLGWGFEFHLAAGLTVGVEFGVSEYDIEILDFSGNAGGDRIGFWIGWTF